MNNDQQATFLRKMLPPLSPCSCNTNPGSRVISLEPYPGKAGTKSSGRNPGLPPAAAPDPAWGRAPKPHLGVAALLLGQPIAPGFPRPFPDFSIVLTPCVNATKDVAFVHERRLNGKSRIGHKKHKEHRGLLISFCALCVFCGESAVVHFGSGYAGIGTNTADLACQIQQRRQALVLPRIRPVRPRVDEGQAPRMSSGHSER